MLSQWKNQQLENTYDSSNDYHHVINNKDVMVVSVGDSWTWGDSLDEYSRLQQVYGALVSQALDADWINIGCRGWSNSHILSHIDYLIDFLDQSNYKKIYFIVTLSENGRDIKTPKSFLFDYIKLFEQTGATEKFYDQLMIEIESHWIQQIKLVLNRMDSRYQMIVGQNFVWHPRLVEEIGSLATVLESNWIECLADAQKIARPIRTNLVTGWIFGTINFVHDIVKLKDTTEFKKWSLPRIELADQVNQWLDSSNMNSKKASKHPTAEGHQAWADYILKRLQND